MSGRRSAGLLRTVGSLSSSRRLLTAERQYEPRRDYVVVFDTLAGRFCITLISWGQQFFQETKWSLYGYLESRRQTDDRREMLPLAAEH